MTAATEPTDRLGELVRREEWAEAEQWSVEEALTYADDMLHLNVGLYADLVLFYWWECFDYALLGEYPEWKWKYEPQCSLDEFGTRTEGSA